MSAHAVVDYDRLEESLRALAHARRLELLHILQVPHGLADIRLRPGEDRAEGNPDRAISRQAVQRHLDLLLETGLVVGVEPTRPRGREFVVDPQRIYQVLEELRRVGTVTAGSFVSRDETVDASGVGTRRMEPGPKLVLVHGFVEGKAFPLRPEEDREPAWLVGRKPGLEVCLDYDPFVSLVNSRVALQRGEYRVHDLGVSRNGTWVNWRRVGPEGALLRPGDVLGVGRSLLVFQRE